VPAYVGVLSPADFEAFYVAHRARAVRFARRFVGRNDAEDVAQTVMLYLWRRLDSLPDLPHQRLLRYTRLRAGQLRNSGWRRYLTLPTDAETLDVRPRALAEWATLDRAITAEPEG
jgi:DNA-directed RNA polymerase specialized sigma24 family protein